MYFCGLSGEVVTKGDYNYEVLRQMWNRAIQKFPIAIVYCENYYDVRNAILWANDRSVPIRIRSGGHNYEGYSNGNSMLVIDISKMNNISINYKENTVKIDGGVRNSQLYNFISEKGYPFPGGTCPTVCVSGYSLGGGWGLSSRKLGLGCDSLLEVELIDYKGDLIVANNYKNQDLFWAVRGAGGGNFGVVVSIKFKLPSKVENVTFFEINYDNPSINTQCKFFDIWQRWIDSVDNDINMRAGIYNTLDDGMYIYTIGICYKDIRETKKLLQPFSNIEGANMNLRYVSFLKAINEVANIYPKYEHFKFPGRFANKYLSSSQIREIIDIVNRKRPKGSILTSINMYGLGGEVSQVDNHATAFYYRDAKYILLLQSEFKGNYYKEINEKWVNENFPHIYNLTKGSYVNFPYNKLNNYKFEYYGGNIIKLDHIKKKYDPYNIFSFPQGIGN